MVLDLLPRFSKDKMFLRGISSRKSLGILMITPFFSPNIGGVETHLDDLCGYLSRRGHRVSIVTYQPLMSGQKAAALEVKRGMIINRMSWFGHGLFNRFEPFPLFEVMYLFPALYLRTLFLILTGRRHVDLIITHGLVASLVGRFIQPLFRKRMVATVHTIYYLDKKPLLRRIFGWVLAGYDRVLFVSERVRREFVGFGVDATKSGVFTYWADHKRFRPLNKTAAKKMLDWYGKFVVLFVGRLIREKGVDVLVRTARMTVKDVSYVFVCSGSYDEFREMIGANIPPNVIYVGPVDYSRLHYYYGAADVFVLPSQGREGFSRAVLEAALCGTPVVASNVGCLSEVVDSKVGRLVSPPTSEGFAKVIDHLYFDREELESLSKSCVEYAREHFTERNARAVEEAFMFDGDLK